MGKKYKPLTPKYPHMLHGGDYNPDQWIDYPEIIEKMCSLLAEEAKITGILGNVSVPDGIGINYRDNEAKRYIFVGNFSDTEKTVSLSKTYTNILNDDVMFGGVKLEPYEIVILEEDI